MIGVFIVTNKIGVGAVAGDLPLAFFVSLFTGFILAFASWDVNDKKYINLKEKENGN